MTDLNRRQLISRSGALGLSGLCIPLLRPRSAFGQTSEPHFFIQYILAGGWDTSYLFDARPLSMRAAGQIQNYLGEEPEQWTGNNGGTLLATSLAKPFKKYFDQQQLSVLNGVFMGASFDGHEQNKNIILTGNAFGGPAMHPFINRMGAPIDALQLGSLFGVSISNGEQIVRIKAEAVNKLAKGAKQMLANPENPRLSTYIRSRLKALASSGSHNIARGAKEIDASLTDVPALRSKLAESNIASQPDAFSYEVKAALKYFERGLTNSAILCDEDQTLDVHDAAGAQRQPEIYKEKGERIGQLLDLLNQTQYGSTQKSYLDLTTVMVTSEFGRTMRQTASPIDRTGTDHNPLSNSILLGGKGIKGGVVVGQSDWQDTDEVLSGAHVELDPKKLKLLGSPFDYSSMTRSSLMPNNYQPEHYLNYSSVANTLFSLFGADSKEHWEIKRNGAKAPLISGLLS